MATKKPAWTAKELCKLANRLDYHSDDMHTNELVMISEYILATVKPDDDEPVSDDWLRSIGLGSGVKLIIHERSSSCDCLERVGGDSVRHLALRYVNKVYGPQSAYELPVELKTRGQVRRLLRVLTGET